MKMEMKIYFKTGVFCSQAEMYQACRLFGFNFFLYDSDCGEKLRKSKAASFELTFCQYLALLRVIQ